MKESVGRSKHKLTLVSVCELMLLIGIGGPAMALLFGTAPAAHRRPADIGTQGPASGPRPPAMPQNRVDTSMPRGKGRVLEASSSEGLQAALDQARRGDVVDLKPGIALRGNFILPKKTAGDADRNSKWITITSSRLLPGLLPAGRVSPALTGRLPILTSMNSEPALRAAPGSGYYRLIGIEMTIAPSVSINYGILRLGEGTETSVEELPHDIVVDRCYIHGLPSSNLRRGIALNCARSAVIHSWISECHEAGADSQAICCWNGPGPFEISDNYLEASGENVMFGGADPSVPGLIPSDITFTQNYCRKPLTWRAPSQARAKWSVKNLFELKNARRVLIDSNVFDNNWVDAQTGYAVLFKSVDQDGKAPWSATTDVTFRRNLVRHASSCVNIEGRDANNPSGRTERVLIENNRFEDINSGRWGGEGVFIKMTGAQDVAIDHNTVLATGSILIAYGEPNDRFAFTRNVVCHNSYGIKGDGTATGTPTLQRFFRGYVVSGNVIIGGVAPSYPPGNCFSSTQDVSVQQSGTVHVPGCPGSDDKSAGCDLNLIELLAAAGAPPGPAD